MKRTQTIEIVITAMMFLLFVYSAFSKIADLPGFVRAIHKQPFEEWFSNILVWILPTVEIIVAGMLLLEKTRIIGSLVFIAMMLIFTTYIGLILMHFFPYVPCSCGGVIESLGWKWHLVFNIFFLLIALISLRLQKCNSFSKFDNKG